MIHLAQHWGLLGSTQHTFLLLHIISRRVASFLSMCFWAKNNCAPCSHLVTRGKHSLALPAVLCKTSDQHRWFIGLVWWRRDVWIKSATADLRVAPTAPNSETFRLNAHDYHLQCLRTNKTRCMFSEFSAVNMWSLGDNKSWRVLSCIQLKC